MTIFTTFFPEKTLITILKCLPLPADNKKQILDHLIAHLILDDFWWHNFIRSEFWWYTNLENAEEIDDDWYDIDISDH